MKEEEARMREGRWRAVRNKRSNENLFMVRAGYMPQVAETGEEREGRRDGGVVVGWADRSIAAACGRRKRGRAAYVPFLVGPGMRGMGNREWGCGLDKAETAGCGSGGGERRGAVTRGRDGAGRDHRWKLCGGVFEGPAGLRGDAEGRGEHVPAASKVGWRGVRRGRLGVTGRLKRCGPMGAAQGDRGACVSAIGKWVANGFLCTRAEARRRRAV